MVVIDTETVSFPPVVRYEFDLKMPIQAHFGWFWGFDQGRLYLQRPWCIPPRWPDGFPQFLIIM